MRIKTVLFSSFLLLSISSTTALAVGNNLQETPGKGQMRACQAREAAVKNRMAHLMELATKMETKFDNIAKKVEDYYVNKVVPSGKTVQNYSTLVADIQAQKQTVQAALTTAQTDANAFSCTSGTPKQQMTQFRTDMQTTKQDLKKYRAAIKNLIVAVRSAKGTK